MDLEDVGERSYLVYLVYLEYSYARRTIPRSVPRLGRYVLSIWNTVIRYPTQPR